MSDFGIGLMIVGFVALVSWVNKKEKKDREENPEKWAAIDADRLRKKEEQKRQEYDAAMKKVPPSEWMRMNRYEKAAVLERREKATKARFG